MKKVNDMDDKFDGNLKDQVSLIGLLVLFVGIVSTEAYYAAFNVKYQLLGLPSFHIIYRGITSILSTWSILVTYVLSAIWLAERRFIYQTIYKYVKLSYRLLTYVFIAVMIAANYWLAQHSGLRAAKADMFEGTCTLPKVVSIMAKDGKPLGYNKPIKNDYIGLRMLLIDSSYVILFDTLKDGHEESVNHIIRLSKEDAHVIKTRVK